MVPVETGYLLIMELTIGTSGWQYRDWRGVLYPPGVPTRRWLTTYAESFDTVEINNSFYRLPSSDQFTAWANAVPDGFTFAVKASRYITHVLRLRHARDAVDQFVAAARALGPKLGPVLLQLPPTLAVGLDDLERTLDAFPRDMRIAVEFRHPSWFTDTVGTTLAARDVSCVLADRRSQVTGHRTATWAYVRMHEGRGSPSPCYGDRALRAWVDRLDDLWGAGLAGYVYFNNDHQGCAVRNAQRLRVFLPPATAGGFRARA
jgi:uncharacterized protein YecE (DUF72 family)